MIDRAEAVDTLIKAFPSIEADIRDETWTGLVHLEISCFARYTQQQIDSRNEPKLRRCFDVARKFTLYGDEQLMNAMYVSFLEHLNVEDQKSEAQLGATIDATRSKGRLRRCYGQRVAERSLTAVSSRAGMRSGQVIELMCVEPSAVPPNVGMKLTGKSVVPFARGRAKATPLLPAAYPRRSADYSKALVYRRGLAGRGRDNRRWRLT